MHYSAERNERLRHRHAMVLAIALHLALVAMLYFKMSSESEASKDTRPTKAKVTQNRPTAQANSVLRA